MSDDRASAAIKAQDGMTVGDLIAQLASIGDFGAVVQFTRDDAAFYVASQVQDYPDGAVVVGIVNPWDDGSTRS